MAGHDLQAATDALDSANAWSGMTPPEGATQNMMKARQLAEQLIMPDAGGNSSMEGGAKADGSKGDVPQDASKTLQKLGDSIQKCMQSSSDKS